jgi:hypothetical protein
VLATHSIRRSRHTAVPRKGQPQPTAIDSSNGTHASVTKRTCLPIKSSYAPAQLRLGAYRRKHSVALNLSAPLLCGARLAVGGSTPTGEMPCEYGSIDFFNTTTGGRAPCSTSLTVPTRDPRPS